MERRGSKRVGKKERDNEERDLRTSPRRSRETKRPKINHKKASKQETASDSVVTRAQASRGTSSLSLSVSEANPRQQPTRMDQTPKKDETQTNSTAGPSSEDLRSEFRSMAESRLQGILKSFGRVEELFNVGQSAGKRIKDIVENLNSPDLNKIRLGTDDLNNLLNNTAEDAYSTFPTDQLLPALVRCMSLDDDVDVTLKAIRCLGTFARSLPSSCNSMVNHGAVPALCTRLLAVEVIDVAEESIRAIKYISKENPECCLTSGALCAVLSYLDFFSQHERRDAVESAAHMCRGLKADNCVLVIDQVPTLVNLLGYEDAVLVEKAALALLRICEASVENPENLISLSTTELVGKSLELISGASASPLKSSTFFRLVKILTLCAGNNAKIAEILLINSISEILHNMFASSASGWKPGSSSNLVQTPEQLSRILELTISLLPKDSSEPTSTSGEMSSELTEFYENNPELIAKFGSDILPVLLQVHNVTISRPVRAKILHVWSKVVKIMDKDSFQSTAKDLRISSLLGPLLTSSQGEVVLQAMGLVEALIEKLPEKFRKDFFSEGVVHAISHLAGLNEETTNHTSSSSSNSAAINQEFLEIIQRAQNFLNVHFHGFTADQDSEGVCRLKMIATNLEFPETCQNSLTALLSLINEEGVSTFEFLRSSVIEALNSFLQIEDRLQTHNEYEENIEEECSLDSDQALSNVKKLVEVGLSSMTSNGSSPLQGLVHKLQEAVSACETFPVRHVIQRNIRDPGPASKTGSDELKTQNLRLASLGQPLKLKFERSEDEKDLRELPPSQVVVEPLMIMHALEEHLWPRVKPGESSTTAVNSASVSGNQQQLDTDANDQSSSTRRVRLTQHQSGSGRGGGGGRVGIIRQTKYQTPSKTSSVRLSHSPDSEALSFSHDESEEGNGGGGGGGIFHEADLIIDDEDDEDLDDEELSDEDDLDEDEEDEDMESVSRVHNLDPNSEVDEMEDSAGRPSSSSAHERSYAELVNTNAPGLSEIEFCMGDVVIKPQATVFQAVRENIAMRLGYEDELEGKHSKISHFRQKWEETHIISYRRRQTKMDISPSSETSKQKRSLYAKTSKLSAVLRVLQKVHLPEELDIDVDLKQILLLMKMLDTINSIAQRFQKQEGRVRPLSRTEFISSKLTTKLTQQIQDPLTICSSSAPSWTKHLVCSCRFLFPFEVRRKYFYCRLGAPRALLFFNKEYEANGEKKESLKVERSDHGEVKLSKLKSNKVRVSRSKILSTAMKVMELYAHNTSEVIEVQYFNESGVGEGPTLEFYTLVSQELQEKSLQMWRDDSHHYHYDHNHEPQQEQQQQQYSQTLDHEMDQHQHQHQHHTKKLEKDENSSKVYASKGVFPRPYPINQIPPKVLHFFAFMGKTVARALIDGRLMDMNINPLFFRILRGEFVDLYDIQSIDTHLGSVLEKLQGAKDKQIRNKSSKVVVDGAYLEDLCLPYTLPGYEDYPLTDKEKSMEFVDGKNLQKYIDSVVNGTLFEGIESQMNAFKEGFQSVLPIEMLEIFYDDEMDLLLRGTQGCWTVEELSESVHFSHGYSPLCDQARWFLEILSELDDNQKRSFLQFLTGSPRLPPGGIGALSPKLTVVQRLNNNEGASENDLPSVATCVNFLKLPKYGSKEVMKDRLLVAFNEGQYAFDLS